MTIITERAEKIHDVSCLHVDIIDDVLCYLYAVPEGDKNVIRHIAVEHVSHILN